MSIVKKNKVYFFRGYVPKKLLTLLRQQTFDKSLKTKNKNKAIIKAKPLAIRFKYLMKELELMIENSGDIYTYLDEYLNTTFKNREDSLYTMPFTELDKLLNNGYFADSIDFLQYAISYNDFSIINEYIKEALSNYDKDLNDSDMYTIRPYIAKQLLEQAIDIRTNVKNNYYDIEHRQQDNIARKPTSYNKIPQPTQPHTNNNLQYYINEFLDSEKIESSSTVDAISLRTTALKSFLLEFGDIDVKSVTLKDLKTYRDRLGQLPQKALAKNNKHYKNAKNLMDIININKEHNYTQETISEGTIGKYISIVKRFFKFLNSNDYIDKNIADVLKPKKYTSITKEDKSLPFDNEDLEIIFSSSFYTTKLENNMKTKIEKVFAPIVALYSGLRLNELASLCIKDIQEENGIYYFDINNERDKSIKNKQSFRKTPIHDKIIEAGFLDYVSSLADDQELRIWGNLSKKIKNKQTGEGTYSSKISSWFSRLKINLGFTTRKKCFHSFRHNVLNDLKQQRVSTEEIAQIAGHSNNSITTDRYGEAYSVKSLAPIVNKIHYDVSALDELIPKLKALIKTTDF